MNEPPPPVLACRVCVAGHDGVRGQQQGRHRHAKERGPRGGGVLRQLCVSALALGLYHQTGVLPQPRAHPVRLAQDPGVWARPLHVLNAASSRLGIEGRPHHGARNPHAPGT